MKRLSTWLEQTCHWLICVILILVPAGFSWLLHDSYELVKIEIFYAAVFLLLFLWCAKGLLEIRLSGDSALKIKRSSLEIPAAGFLLLYALALANSWDPRLSFWGQYKGYAYGFLPLLCGGLLFWLVLQFYSAALEKRVLGFAALGGMAAACYGIAQYFGFEFSRMPANAGGRVWSSFGNPVYFGSFLMMAFLPALHLSEKDAAGGKRSREGIFWLIAACLILCGLFLSLTRSAWAGLGAGLLAYFTATGRILEKRRGAALMAILLAAFLIYSPARRRAATLFHPDGVDYARFEAWKQAGRIFLSHPWTGTGPDTFIYAFRKNRTLGYIRATGADSVHSLAHNDLLQYAATSGVLGLGGYLWLWGAALKTGWRRRSEAGGPVVLAALIALLIYCQFNAWTPATMVFFWVLLGLLAGRSLSLSAEIPVRRPHAPILLVPLFLSPAALWFASRPAVADYHFERALRLLAAQNYEKGVQELEKAAGKNRGVPIYYERWLNVFRTLAQTEPSLEARRFLLNNALFVAQQAVLWLPRNPDCRNNLGVTLMWITQSAGIDRKSEAKAAFEKAVEMDPLFVDAWANLARVAHFNGDLDGEISLWRSVLEIAPGHWDGNRLLPALLQAKASGPGKGKI